MSVHPIAVFDQATELRRLVREAPPADLGRNRARPRLIAVAGGKGGVGTTTIAVNLAVAMACRGHRTMLADLSLSGRDAANLCGMDSGRDTSVGCGNEEEIASRLRPGPAGLRVVAGWDSCDAVWPSTAIEDRLIESLAALGRIVDFAVVDAGNTPGRTARRLWRTADVVLLVATPEPASVMNAYAAVKSLASPEGPGQMFSAVSRAAAAVAQDVHARLAQACHRFLGIRLRFGGFVPPAAEVEEASRRSEPFVLAAPQSRASRQIASLAELLGGLET